MHNDVKQKPLGLSKSFVTGNRSRLFFYRGVPGSADMIPSASEPVVFASIFIIHDFRKKSMDCVKNRLAMH